MHIERKLGLFKYQLAASSYSATYVYIINKSQRAQVSMTLNLSTRQFTL